MLCLVNRERVEHGERALRVNAQLQRAAQRHTFSMAFGDYFEHTGPAARPRSPHEADGLPLRRARRYAVGENIAGARSTSPRRARSSPPGWPRPTTARTSSTRASATARSASPPTSAALGHGQRARSTRRTSASSPAAEAALPRHLPRGPGGCAGITCAHITTTRRRNSYGSTRRQVRDRHRLRARHRPRDRGAARRAGRTGPDQRPRRRRRRAGGRRDRRRDRCVRRRPHQARRPRRARARPRSTRSARSTSSSTTPATRSTRRSTR